MRCRLAVDSVLFRDRRPIVFLGRPWSPYRRGGRRNLGAPKGKPSSCTNQRSRRYTGPVKIRPLAMNRTGCRPDDVSFLAKNRATLRYFTFSQISPFGDGSVEYSTVAIISLGGRIGVSITTVFGVPYKAPSPGIFLGRVYGNLKSLKTRSFENLPSQRIECPA